MASISDLKSIIVSRKGIVRPSRFSVSISAPSALNTRDLSTFCETVTLPTKKISTATYRTTRQEFKLPTGYTNDDISMLFLLTGDFYVKTLMDSWLALVIGSDSYRIKYPSEYCGTIEISQLLDDESSAYTVRYNQAFPTDVTPIQFDSNGTDQIQKLSVTMAYYDATVIGR